MYGYSEYNTNNKGSCISMADGTSGNLPMPFHAFESTSQDIMCQNPGLLSGDPPWGCKTSQSTNRPSFGMIEENTKEEDYCNMSFVGIIVLTDRVIGFADSKSSKESKLGGYQDPERGIVQKLFKNDRSILVAFGCNELYDKDGKLKHLEDWINENYTVQISPVDLILKLHNDLLLNIKNNNGCKYSFLIGGFDKNGYYKRHLYTEYNGYYIGIKCYTQDIYTGGHKYYTPLTNEIWEKLQSKGLLNAEDSIKDIINNIIQSFDQLGGYNPVGGPIITETLYRK